MAKHPDKNFDKKNAPLQKNTAFDSNEKSDAAEGMRLNKYIAHCGICSRRKAAEYIKVGLVTVNSKVVNEIGHRVMEGDKVTFRDKIVKPETNKVYLLLNKPKDFVTTVSDEKGRKTVMDIVGKKIKERIYPVGRLDRATLGLLLLTNDGDLAKKLSHPSHGVSKVYQVELDKPVSSEHLNLIRKGLTLEDGPVPVDGINYIQNAPKTNVGIEIHIGRNRIVRRIFEHLGYRVKKLDRTIYAGLTKKDLPRGRFRHLTEKEVIMLKHFT
jgi:23S rRNA pseudouridine2605 synthase